MAQKATKTLAAANTARLNQTLYLTLAIHLTFWLLRALVYRASLTRTSTTLYALFSAPQLLVQLYFERLSRPTLGANGAIVRPGEDLDAKGLTEYMWDVLYWTYVCLVVVAVFGDWAWVLWAAVPLYALYAAWGLYATMRPAYPGAADPDAAVSDAAASKRQAKMEKRGGQKKMYR